MIKLIVVSKPIIVQNRGYRAGCPFLTSQKCLNHVRLVLIANKRSQKKIASNFILLKNDSRGPGTKPDISLWSFGAADTVLEAGGVDLRVCQPVRWGSDFHLRVYLGALIGKMKQWLMSLMFSCALAAIFPPTRVSQCNDMVLLP